MADSKIRDLSAGGALQAADAFPIARSSSNFSVAFSDVVAGKLSNINVSAGATSNNLSALTFSNSNGISFGLTGSTVTATVGTNYAGVGETVGTTAGTDLALTVNTDGVSIAYPKWISTARASTDAVGLNTAQTGLTWTVNSSGISIDAGAYLTTARRSTDAVGLNTAQTNVTWTVNSSGISFNAGGYNGTGFTSTSTAGSDIKATNNTAGLSMAVPAYITAQSNQTEGMYAIGNSTVNSSSTFDARTMSVAGAGGISIGYSSNSGLIISGPVAQTNQSAIKGFGASNTGNTAGNTGISSGIDWVIAGTNNITVSQSTVGGGPNTLWLSGPSGAQATISRFAPFQESSGSAMVTMAPASTYFNVFTVPVALAVSNVGFLLSFNAAVPAATSAASTGTERYSYSRGITLFTRQDFGANSTNISQWTTASFGLTVNMTYGSTSQGMTISWVTDTTGGTTSFNTTSNAGNWSNFLTGLKLVRIPLVTTLSVGEYFIGHANSSTTGTTNSNVTVLSVSVLRKPLEQMSYGAFSSSGSLTSAFGVNDFMGFGFGVASAVTTNATMAGNVISSLAACFPMDFIAAKGDA